MRTVCPAALCFALTFGCTPAKPVQASLPDWSGVWARQGRGIFDYATADPPTGLGAGQPGEREHPPYTPAWEKKYLANIALVNQGRFTDPLTRCLPRGVPSMMNSPDGFEFVVRPEQVWIIAENGSQVRRIYTDGRPHRTGDDLFPTYTGDSIGHWEGDTLVADTIGLRDDMILDRTGATLSGQAHIVERMRKLADDTIEWTVTIDDALALTQPWAVTKRYKRLPKGTVIFDYACAENNRNPVGSDGRSLALDAYGKPIG